MGDLVCNCVLPSIPEIDCPLHGDVTSQKPADPELEAALKATEGEVVSVPPSWAKPDPCAAHDSPFVTIEMKEGGTNWKVYEDGCEEPL